MSAHEYSNSPGDYFLSGDTETIYLAKYKYYGLHRRLNWFDKVRITVQKVWPIIKLIPSEVLPFLPAALFLAWLFSAPISR